MEVGTLTGDHAMTTTRTRPATLRWTVALAATTICLLPQAASGQGGRGGQTRVTYTVEFTTAGPLLDRNCTATGTDVLTGTLVGFEPAPPDEPNEYVGTLKRTTQISTCGSRTNASGNEVVCTFNITGSGFADVVLTIEPGQRDGYLQYLTDRVQWTALLPPRPAAPSSSSVTGTCDPAEMAQMQGDYDTGSTAGSPNGQPIEVPSLPPSSYPFTFAPNPPQSIWTLKVLSRRP